MYPNNFYMPSYGMGFRPMGFISKSKGLFSSIKGINWRGLINNANKTLGTINQAIPLVKQAGPMFNNMKSMIRLASAFNDETTSSKKKEKTIEKKQNDNIKKDNINIISNDENNNIISNNSFYNAPNFFI